MRFPSIAWRQFLKSMKKGDWVKKEHLKFQILATVQRFIQLPRVISSSRYEASYGVEALRFIPALAKKLRLNSATCDVR